MSLTVVGIFDSASDAQKAVDHLISDGFSRDKIDLSVNANADTTQNSYTDNSTKNKNEDFGDSISNFFSNLFTDDEDEARNYSTVAQRGSVVTVHTSSYDESERAATILDEYGTVDVHERARFYSDEEFNRSNTDNTIGSFGSEPFGNRAASYEENQLENDATTVNSFDDNNLSLDETGPIKVIEEELQVGKREVETGGVRIRSRIVEKPVEETLRLREERVWVNRNRVDRPATDAELSDFKEGTIELTQHAEVPVIGKEARVVEEITVGKAVEEHEQTIKDKVRSTEVDIEERGRKDDLGLAENR